MVVSGRVQGVGFRAYVRGLAHRLGVRGEVWNRRDGAVEIEAFAEDAATLDQFARDLEFGPGRIDRVSRTQTSGEAPDEFRVTHRPW